MRVSDYKSRVCHTEFRQTVQSAQRVNIDLKDQNNTNTTKREGYVKLIMNSSSSTKNAYDEHGLHFTAQPPHYALHAGLVPLKFYTPLQFDTQPEQIDELVALEMQQLRDHYADEEQRYVEQMLLENPVVVERRAMPTSISATPKQLTAMPATTTTTATPATPATTTATAATNGGSETLLQRQRAESCRKSRYNNKIKKAKLRFRHKFVSNQMSERLNVLDYIRGVIAQAETQLLSHGYSHTALEKLRHAYGVDRPMDTNTMSE